MIFFSKATFFLRRIFIREFACPTTRKDKAAGEAAIAFILLFDLLTQRSSGHPCPDNARGRWRDHRPAAPGNDDDAAACGAPARRGRRAQLPGAGQLVEHGPRLELGERGADAASHAAPERSQAPAGGRAEEAVDAPLRRLFVDVVAGARAGCTTPRWRRPVGPSPRRSSAQAQPPQAAEGHGRVQAQGLGHRRVGQPGLAGRQAGLGGGCCASSVSAQLSAAAVVFVAATSSVISSSRSSASVRPLPSSSRGLQEQREDVPALV